MITIEIMAEASAVALAKFADNLANDVSGGPQQRVAVARALAMNPDLVLARRCDRTIGEVDGRIVS